LASVASPRIRPPRDPFGVTLWKVGRSPEGIRSLNAAVVATMNSWFARRTAAEALAIAIASEPDTSSSPPRLPAERFDEVHDNLLVLLTHGISFLVLDLSLELPGKPFANFGRSGLPIASHMGASGPML